MKTWITENDFANFEFWFNDLFANTLLKLDYETRMFEKALACVDTLRFDTVCGL